MDIRKIQQYKSAFDSIAKEIKDEEGNAIEVWYARELQQVLGYARWENFVVAIGRAMESCKTLGINVDDHFREVTKMIALAKGAQREIQDLRQNTCETTAVSVVCLDNVASNPRSCHLLRTLRRLSDV